MSRRLDGSAILEIVLAVPVVVGSVGVMTLIGRLVWPEQAWVVPVGWGLCGLLLLIRLVENGLGWVMFGMRRPSPQESGQLEPLWQKVCRKASVDSDDFLLWIEQSRGLNAMAAGGHMVAVTKEALRRPPHVLEAILAHELGHHLSGHGRVSLLRWWYELPARLTFLVVRLLAWLLLTIVRVFVQTRDGVDVLISAVLTLGLLIGLAFLNPWLVAGPVLSPVMAWSRRRAEYRADWAAARFGYRETLIRELRMWQAARGGDVRPWLVRVFASHPAEIDRVNRLLRHA
ncbi:STE24 endopeptidase [Kibdelosporangium banguiense]|uniref:STE24 endopeptidase n=1 Tax=Kibdelosporangium banguiense TaxID=1365924 RepID=A0ABS4TQ19_9PSEU|nr:M48 family metalloprotease [Kibdelosporangium banguiense]MBP2326006.1 STE24 endopeptidase [Kibdelosporangium banguiense]